jgi:hypothetical protein
MDVCKGQGPDKLHGEKERKSNVMRRKILIATLLTACTLTGCGHSPTEDSSKQDEKETARSPQSVNDGDFRPGKTQPVKIQK